MLFQKRIQLFKEYRGDPSNAHTDARLFTILTRRKELIAASDGNQVTEIKFV